MTCRGERLSRATNRYPAVGNRVSEDAVEVDSGGDSLRADLLAKCTGLYADRVACFASDHPFRLFPFRGSTSSSHLAPSALVRGLIYPILDPTGRWYNLPPGSPAISVQI